MKTSFLSFFSLLFLLGACSKSDDVISEFTSIENGDHNIQITETENSLIFRIEVLKDTTNNLLETFPDVDFINLIFDANQNGIIDNRVDFGISTTSSTNNIAICSYFCISESSTTPCGEFETSTTINGEFISTSLLAQEHIVWTITIPKSDLDTSNELHFVVKIFGNRTYTTYPKGTEFTDESTVSFAETLVYSWN